MALGASRWRIARHLMAESVILGVLGSAVGVFVCDVGIRFLLVLAPPLPGLDRVGLDPRVLVVAMTPGVPGGVLFGTVPSFVSVPRALDTVGRAGKRTLGRTGRTRLETGLVSVQIAVTTVLLVGTGLFTRSLGNLMSVHPGFEPGDLVVMQATLSQGDYPGDEARSSFYREALARIRTVPGVVAATATDNFFFPAQRMNMDRVRIPSAGTGEDLLPTLARFSVAPGYFQQMSIPILAGRGFEEGDDREDSPPVVVVNQKAVDEYWSGHSPVGIRLRHWTGEATVVGVVGNVRFQRLDSEISPTLYVPLGRTGSRGYQFLVSAGGDPSIILAEVREAIGSVDRNVPVGEAASAASLLARSGSSERFRGWVWLTFALSATVLAMTGVFGVTARSVGSRVNELGIRMTLGAETGPLVAMTLRNGLMTGIMGALPGLGGAYVVFRLSAGFLFGLEPFDVPTYLGVAVLLLGATLLACYLPARRISRIDPAEVLRSD